MSRAAADAEQELTPEQKRIIELENQVANLSGRLADNAKQAEGWLITTPNPVYDGAVYGIQFTNGTAWIPMAGYYRQFEQTPEPLESIRRRYEAQIKAGWMTIDEFKAAVDAQRARESKLTSQRAAEALGNDFGYTVEYFSSDRILELQSRMTDRAKQRRETEAMLRANAAADTFSPPGWVK